MGTGFLVPTGTPAVTIEYEAVNLDDLDSGKDLWQYRYTVDSFPFGSDSGFSIFFDVSLYTELQNPPPAVNSSWDVITLQPDVNLPHAGLYDALALETNPSVDTPFVVNFVWLGNGAPGSQAFEVYDPDFVTIQSDNTIPRSSEPTPAIPESDAALLFAAGLMLLRGWKHCGVARGGSTSTT